MSLTHTRLPSDSHDCTVESHHGTGFSLLRWLRILPMLMLTLTATSMAQENDSIVRRLMAPAVLTAATEEGGKSDRWEFNFGRNRGNAWLAKKGELFVDTWVQHRGLLCADYEVGIRFGRGDPACTNVEWLAPAKYVTSRRQCNNALVNHRGADTEVRLTSQFEQVTCAEQLVRCFGNCR